MQYNMLIFRERTFNMSVEVRSTKWIHRKKTLTSVSVELKETCTQQIKCWICMVHVQSQKKQNVTSLHAAYIFSGKFTTQNCTFARHVPLQPYSMFCSLKESGQVFKNHGISFVLNKLKSQFSKHMPDCLFQCLCSCMLSFKGMKCSQIMCWHSLPFFKSLPIVLKSVVLFRF